MNKKPSYLSGFAAFPCLPVALALLMASGCATLTDISTSIGVVSGAITEDQAQSIKRTTTAVSKTFEDITPAQEYYIGRAVAATVFSTYPADNHIALNRYLNLLGQTLALYSDRPETFKGYHFQAIQSQEVNAFAAPGGFILISHGLLKCCRSESELAAVIAHEIGHVEQKHGLKAIKTGRLTSALTILASESGRMLGKQELAEATAALEGSVTDIVSTLVNSGYSRSLEYEADRRATVILTRAGYNPRALTSMLSRMSEKLVLHPGGFGKTHPDPKDRIQRVNQLISRFPALAPDPVARQTRFLAAAQAF